MVMRKIIIKSIILACIVTLFPLSVYAEIQFHDVGERQWYTDSIDWAVKENIIKGFPDGSFRPNAPVTEEHFLMMLARASGIQDDPYTDARVRNMPIYYKLDLPLNRMEAAVYLAANLGSFDQRNVEENAINFLYDNGISNGTGRKKSLNSSDFGGERILTRAEAVTFIHRVVKTGLPLNQKLESSSKVTYSKDVIITWKNEKQFAEVISNLYEIRTGDFTRVEKRFNIDFNIHAVELYEQVSESKDENTMSILLTREGEKNKVLLASKYENENTIAVTQAILNVYVNENEARLLTEQYFQKKLANNNSKVTFKSDSEYIISYSNTDITIIEASVR